MLDHFMNVTFHNFQFPPDDVSILRHKYANIEAVRTHVKAYPGLPQPDLFWQSQLTKLAMMLADVVDAMVYNTKFDCNLQHAVKHYK
eukprot:3716565-Lingulodinium_polyedra.AAC.1